MPAKRPSKRRHRVHADVELKLIPVMSLLVVLVPMLLQTAVFQKITSISMNLPSADEVRYLDEPTPEELAKSVTVAMTDEGFVLASGDETLARVPLTAEGRFDFEGLGRALAEAKAKFPKQESLVLLVEDAVVYDDIVHAMDRARPHFPDVSLADRVQAPAEE
ncbi:MULTISPECIES: ExbD/TolR family protein [Deferrisoma]